MVWFGSTNLPIAVVSPSVTVTQTCSADSMLKSDRYRLHQLFLLSQNGVQFWLITHVIHVAKAQLAAVIASFRIKATVCSDKVDEVFGSYNCSHFYLLRQRHLES